MNYRDHIQEMIQQLQDIYDRAGALRDHAEGHEKEAFNQVRGKTGDTWPWLQRLDNALSRDRANEDVGNWRKK
jgi:hypothetical protein